MRRVICHAMNHSTTLKGLTITLLLFKLLILGAQAEAKLPAALSDWKDWVLRSGKQLNSPPLYSDAAKRLPLWTSALQLDATATGAQFTQRVEVMDETWLPLPGGTEWRPQGVKVNDVETPVITRDKRAAILLPVGRYKLTGSFRWADMPERITLPHETGIISLTIDGTPVEIPDWEPDGTLWLRRTQTKAEDRDFLNLQVYRLLQDGIPLWLDTELELSIAGKSREESLGCVLPEGWLIASIDSPIPCAVDDQGDMKVQVRPGKWPVRFRAFRTTPLSTFQYPAGRRPVSEQELIGLRAEPSLRVLELRGVRAVDVSQTTFPERWRALPLHLWETKNAFTLEEKLRGMGDQRAAGLDFKREFWLDENGTALTWRDTISGDSQRLWRLDAAAGQELGAVKIDGEGHLITLHPCTQARGVELRSKSLKLEATGRAAFTQNLSATGWQSDAGELAATLHLPPGWRVLAMRGPEWSEGDWISAWTMLDVFLILITSLAVFRMFGWGAGLATLLGLVLVWQEPGAPRATLLLMTAALAAYRFWPASSSQRSLPKVIVGASALLLAGRALPFASDQITGILYPQLEQLKDRRYSPMVSGGESRSDPFLSRTEYDEVLSSNAPIQKQKPRLKSNMVYDLKAKIQTGPALPQWTGRTVEFGWHGPVTAKQVFRAILLPVTAQRLISVLRLGLLLLAGWLIWRRVGRTASPPSINTKGGPSMVTNPASVLLTLLVLTGTAQKSSAQSASIPHESMLQELRDHLQQPSPAFPYAADIPSVRLTLAGQQLSMETTIHAAADCAIPLPGKLPSWSPLSVELDGNTSIPLLRSDGYLWIPVTKGIHVAKVRGLLPATTEWQWTFLLRPHSVEITAPEWTVTGVKPSSMPEAQVFFTRQQATSGSAAAYDRKEINPLAQVTRSLELGLVWQVRTTVTRLTGANRAFSLSLPLLPGERILTAGAGPNAGRLDVRLGLGEESFTWESELPSQPALNLTAEVTNKWVEHWQLATSPVWNVTLAGLAPVYASNSQDLLPSWYPWPGESVQLNVSRPEPTGGETTTVQKVKQTTRPGLTQRDTTLELALEASTGQDFIVTLNLDSEITGLKMDGQPLPVRREQDRLIIPLRPGSQNLQLTWKEAVPLAWSTTPSPVTLPVPSANITTTVELPPHRWILWARGPLQGPAIRFWGILAAVCILACILGRLPHSPLKCGSWILLLIGLTQVPTIGMVGIIGWLWCVAWRGGIKWKLPSSLHNLIQLVLTIGSLITLLVLLEALRRGLLGRPTMYLLGDGSLRNTLQWYKPRSDGLSLPAAEIFSIPLYCYRILMLVWALWLAGVSLRLAKWALAQLTKNGFWHRPALAKIPATTPPPLEVKS